VTRLRALSLALLLTIGLLALPGAASAAPVQACNPDPKVATSLCLTYDLAVTKPGTVDPETRTQRPVDLSISFANTSSNHDTDNSKWFRSLTVNLLSGGGMEPVVTGSANLPQGLLIAGAAADCGNTGNGDFSGCPAGHGLALASGGVCFISGPCQATFGIQRIFSNKTNLGTHFLQFTAVIKACVQVIGSCDSLQQFSQTFTIDKTSGPSPLSFTVVITKGDLPVDDVTLDSGNIALSGASNTTTTGPADKTYNWFRLPARCGTVSASATGHSSTSAVTVTKSFTVSGCAQLTPAWSKTKVLYGGSSSITGSLIDFDTQTPMAGKTIKLKACPVGKACTTTSKLTSATGLFAFSVKPSRNTAYTVSYAGSGTPDTDAWVPGTAYNKTVNVTPIVTIKASTLKIKSGGSVKLTGSVQPNHAKKTVVIQRKVAGVWKPIGEATLSAKSSYSKSVVLKGAKGSKALLRVILPAHADHLIGTSRTVAITFV
jgi:hypothetical protein